MGEDVQVVKGAPDSGRPRVVLCEECDINPSKYKCPACTFRSCSLSCVNAHKKRSGCTGKRNRTEFVPLSQFNDNVLVSDYNFLQEVKSAAESAQRTRTNLCGYSHFKLPFHLRGLRNAAGSRRMKLLFLPSGMSKRTTNQSRYDPRKKYISWTIEWRFHSTEVVLHDNGVHEDAILSTVIEKHLQPGPWNHQLKEFCDQRDHLKFFIHKFPKGPKSPYRELDMKASLRQQLANIVILEYPVIHVFLPTHSCHFEVIKDAPLLTPKSDVKPEVDVDDSTTKGILFREEEFDEECNLESRDCGREQNDDSSWNTEVFPGQLNAGSRVSNIALGECLERRTGGDYQSERTDEMEYGFDRELIDAYSDLVSEMNPDDFLNLEGERTPKVHEGEVAGDCSLSLTGDDLEEGEIFE